MYKGSITDVDGLQVGHAQDTDGLTGVSVVLAEKGAVCSVDVRGAAPGTRETDLLGRGKSVNEVHAVMLAGGSAFGLAAADGAMEYCEQHEIGLHTEDAIIPAIPAAVIYDLAYGPSNVRPNPVMGYAACANAKKEVQQGSIGVGIGATVGKVMGMNYCQKGGVGTASLMLKNGVTVAAFICVNAFGDVLESDGHIVSGAFAGGSHVNTAKYILENDIDFKLFEHKNTTIGAIATDAVLSKEEAYLLAQNAHNGLARAISPVHTLVDGDTLFGLSYGDKKADLNSLLVASAEVCRRACVNAALSTRPKE